MQNKNINLENNKLIEIEKEVEKNILENNLIQDNDKIVVAVSGGPDSMCLINVLINLKIKLKEKNKINFELIVAHVNHGIREESELEKVYVENYCNEKNIPFFYLKENVPQKALENKMSEETYSRKIRYEFFNKVLTENNANKIAVAHNLDDNVETIFLNIVRGTGLKGLSGMGFVFKNIIRPMLTIEKIDILEYNRLSNLNPCFDKTNELDIYTRNKVRLNLIPYLKKDYNPNILKSINRMRQIVEVDEDFLDKYTKEIFQKCIVDLKKEKIKFDYSVILKEHDAIKNRVVRKIIETKTGDLNEIESIHINDILKLFKNNIKGKKYIIGKKFTIENIGKSIAIIYDNV